jgi:hypothetical protein
VQVPGQQPSDVNEHAVMGVWLQAAMQPVPLTPSVVHAIMSSQLATVGQLPAPGGAIPVSQSSGAVTTPSPQAAAQSPSLPMLQPAGQHVSPL